jgi:hypothetical protein
MATSFSGGRSWSTCREPPTMGKQLVNFAVSEGRSKQLNKISHYYISRTTTENHVTLEYINKRFIGKGLLLTTKLLNQGFLQTTIYKTYA